MFFVLLLLVLLQAYAEISRKPFCQEFTLNPLQYQSETKHFWQDLKMAPDRACGISRNIYCAKRVALYERRQEAAFVATSPLATWLLTCILAAYWSFINHYKALVVTLFCFGVRGKYVCPYGKSYHKGVKLWYHCQWVEEANLSV